MELPRSFLVDVIWFHLIWQNDEIAKPTDDDEENLLQTFQDHSRVCGCDRNRNERL